MADCWMVRLNNRVRPLVEAIARDEEREPAQVVRRLVDRALAEHPVSAREARNCAPQE